MFYVNKILGLIIIIIILSGACMAAGKAVENCMIFIDIPSAIIVLIIASGYGYSKKNYFIKEFGNGAVFGGWMTFLIGLIALSYEAATKNLDLDQIMLAVSILWIAIFYGYLVKLITNVLTR